MVHQTLSIVWSHLQGCKPVLPTAIDWSNQYLVYRPPTLATNDFAEVAKSLSFYTK